MASKKQKKTLLALLKSLAILCLLGYAVVVFISQQVKINDNRNKIEALKAKASATQQANDEYLRLLSLTDEKEYMERIAIEKLGYANPNERRFYDTSRK